MRKLPGTTIEIIYSDSRQILNSLFLSGGLVLSQVCTITDLDTHMVQNWVKRKFVAPPKNKKYNLDQLCRIITINMLKDVLSIDMICSLISHINGVLSDESDDLITDSKLYLYFVDLVDLSHGKIENVKDELDILLQDYQEPVRGSKRKLKEVLEIMLTAHFSAEYKKQALLLCKMVGID